MSRLQAHERLLRIRYQSQYEPEHTPALEEKSSYITGRERAGESAW